MAKASSRRLNFVLEDDRIFTRLSSRQRCQSAKQGDASFRVLYYGGAAGSVPFLWESEPGTPKRTSRDTPIPPLTPPPSYQLSPRASSATLRNKQSKNSKILTSIFPPKKLSGSPSSSSSSSSFSSYSLPSTPYHSRAGDVKARSISRSRSRSGPGPGPGPSPSPSPAQRFAVDDYDIYSEPVRNSPTSTLCFGPRNRSPPSPRGVMKGYLGPIMKIVMSISGHGNKKN